MAKAANSNKRLTTKKAGAKKASGKKAPGKQAPGKKADAAKTKAKPRQKVTRITAPIPERLETDATSAVLDRLWNVVLERRDADPTMSHSARLMSRGTAKVAQKFGEEAVECLIEAVAGNRTAFIAESADVLYHLLVLWVNGGIRPEEVWAELERREGVSGVVEKATRLTVTKKIP